MKENVYSDSKSGKYGREHVLRGNEISCLRLYCALIEDINDQNTLIARLFQQKLG